MKTTTAIVVLGVAGFLGMTAAAMLANSSAVWLQQCAIHRPLADCKVDYEKLHR